VQESGEIDKGRAVTFLRARVRNRLEESLGRHLAYGLFLPADLVRRRVKKRSKKRRNSIRKNPDGIN
jgi:hypothetical protein